MGSSLVTSWLRQMCLSELRRGGHVGKEVSGECSPLPRPCKARDKGTLLSARESPSSGCLVPPGRERRVFRLGNLNKKTFSF